MKLPSGGFRLFRLRASTCRAFGGRRGGGGGFSDGLLCKFSAAPRKRSAPDPNSGAVGNTNRAKLPQSGCSSCVQYQVDETDHHLAGHKRLELTSASCS